MEVGPGLAPKGTPVAQRLLLGGLGAAAGTCQCSRVSLQVPMDQAHRLPCVPPDLRCLCFLGGSHHGVAFA